MVRTYEPPDPMLDTVQPPKLDPFPVLSRKSLLTFSIPSITSHSFLWPHHSFLASVAPLFSNLWELHPISLLLVVSTLPAMALSIPDYTIFLVNPLDRVFSILSVLRVPNLFLGRLFNALHSSDPVFPPSPSCFSVPCHPSVSRSASNHSTIDCYLNAQLQHTGSQKCTSINVFPTCFPKSSTSFSTASSASSSWELQIILSNLYTISSLISRSPWTVWLANSCILAPDRANSRPNFSDVPSIVFSQYSVFVSSSIQSIYPTSLPLNSRILQLLHSSFDTPPFRLPTLVPLSRLWTFHPPRIRLNPQHSPRHAFELPFLSCLISTDLNLSANLTRTCFIWVHLAAIICPSSEIYARFLGLPDFDYTVVSRSDTSG